MVDILGMFIHAQLHLLRYDVVSGVADLAIALVAFL
jgi:hypothetical protein